MSRFVETATAEFIFPGGCQCPGKPHEQDVAVVRTQLGASAKARVGRAELEGAVRLDPLAAHRQLVLEAVESWNLLRQVEGENEGEQLIVAVPINEATIELLDESLVPLAEFIDEHTRGSPPNASGAPSRESSRGSASRTPKRTPKRGT